MGKQGALLRSRRPGDAARSDRRSAAKGPAEAGRRPSSGRCRGAAAPIATTDLVALDEALNRLAEEDPLAAKVVEIRQFAGLGHEQIAAALGITVYLARQKWTYARAWLRNALDR